MGQERSFQSQNEKTLNREVYTVGWISALPVELTAARVMRDEKHGQISIADGDTNTYVLGRVGGHNVVMACLPQGTVGTNSAAIVATNMTRSFPRLRFILLVGVGAGAPDPGNKDVESDIRLGDVVVSKPNMNTGGKSLNKPPSILRTAVANLESLHLAEGSQIGDILEETYRKYPRVKQNFQCPGNLQDHLFQADYEHVTGQEDCRLCQLHRVITRQLRDDSMPRIHYGLIASANQVIRDTLTREHMRSNLGVICFEMEAAGMMDDCPCLVVRGICDYADTHKNKQWQPYAALTAAAYAKELLQSMEASSVLNESSVQLVDILREQAQAIREQTEAIRQGHQSLNINYQSEKYQACHRTFHISEYQRHKDDTNPDAIPGTCRWVLDDAQYRTWLTSTHDDLLWISADPGCGKSVLSKSLVDVHLHNSEDGRPHTVCYFFFKNNEQQNNLSAALCSIIHQLFSQLPNLIHHAMPAFAKSDIQLRRGTHELWRIIQSAACDAGASPVICVLDALDECQEADRKQLIGFLCQSYNGYRAKPRTKSPLKWLVTSRSYDEIVDSFQKISLELPSIRLHGENKTNRIRDEINLVIHARMKELIRELHLSVTKAKELLQQLLSMEHRTYLWLYLAVEAIRDTFRDAVRPRDQVLVRVPASVQEAYEQILARISNKQRKQAATVLAIIVGARRPLDIGEMALALDVATLSPAPVSTTDLTIDAQQLGDRIRRWCGLFVQIVDNRLYLLHEIAKEFLLSHNNAIGSAGARWTHCLPSLEVERMLTTVCIRYLCLEDFNSQYHQVMEKHDQTRQHFHSFFSFAAQYWATHAHLVEEYLDEETQNNIEMLYDTSSERWSHWTLAMWQSVRFGYQFEMNRTQLAAYNGHNIFLQRYISLSPGEINSQDSEGRTGLMWASLGGHCQAVKSVLDAGADINTRTNCNCTALGLASEAGHETIVRMLLDAGANVHAGVGEKDALWAASSQGHEKVVRMLLEAGADVDIHDHSSHSPLYIASCRGHEKVVRVLLDAGAEFGLRQLSLDKSALIIASLHGHEQVVRMLLQAGADVNTRDGFSQSALWTASSQGHEKVVRMLLDAGADVTAGRGEENALWAASSHGHEKVVQILLNAGANINIGELEFRGYALHIASLRGYEKVVKVLLEAGAKVNLRDNLFNESALILASSHGYEKVVQILLDAGAEIDTGEPEFGSCAFHVASSLGYEKVVQVMLQAGAHVDLRDKFLNASALMVASITGRERVVQVLLEAKANLVEDNGGDGHSCSLVAASGNGHEKVVQLLLDADKGTDTNKKKRYDRALHAASANGHQEVVQMLIAASADRSLQGLCNSALTVDSAQKYCSCNNSLSLEAYIRSSNTTTRYQSQLPMTSSSLAEHTQLWLNPQAIAT